jgi:hypothetical protein
MKISPLLPKWATQCNSSCRDSSAGAVHANLSPAPIKIRLREDTVYTRPAAPRSIGGVLDDAIKLYRDSFSKSWPLALIGEVLITIPVLVIRFQITNIPGVGTNPMSAAINPAAAAAMMAVFKSPVIWVSYLALLLLTLGLYNALIVQADGFSSGKPRTIAEAFGTGFRLLPCTLLLSLVMFLGTFVAVLAAGIVAGILGAMHVSPIVQGILLVACIGVMIYVWGRIFLANTALVVERTGVFKSFATSWVLIKSHWWRTAAVYTVAIIIAFAFYLLMGALNTLIFALWSGSSEAKTILSQLVNVAFGSALAPFFPTVLLAMYHDLKLRSEGADLADRVNALPQ